MKEVERLRSWCTSTLFVNLALDGGEVANATPRPIYATDRETIPIVYGAGWAWEQLGTGGRKSRHHRISNSGTSSP